MEILLIILGAFVFFVSPFCLIVGGIFSAPIILKIFTIVWAGSSTLCMAALKEDKLKLTIILPATIIYAMCFCCWYVNDCLFGDFEGSAIVMFLTPFGTLGPLCLLADYICSKREEQKEQEKERLNDITRSEIRSCEKNIMVLEKQVSNNKMILNTLLLFEQCGADVTAIKNHSEVNCTIKKRQLIQQERNKIKKLNDKIRK